MCKAEAHRALELLEDYYRFVLFWILEVFTFVESILGVFLYHFPFSSLVRPISNVPHPISSVLSHTLEQIFEINPLCDPISWLDFPSCSRLAEDEERQLRAAIERVIRIFKSRLFQVKSVQTCRKLNRSFCKRVEYLTFYISFTIWSYWL